MTIGSLTTAGTDPMAQFLRPATRTSLRADDLDRHPTGRTQFLPADLELRKAPSTTLDAASLHRPSSRTTLEAKDLAPAGAKQPVQLGREASSAGAPRASGETVSKDAPDHATLMKAANRLVAQTFYGTLMRQMRNSPFKSDLFSGGRGGDAFSPMFDQYLAERMAGSAGRSLAQSIVRHLERRARGGSAAAASKGRAE